MVFSVPHFISLIFQVEKGLNSMNLHGLNSDTLIHDFRVLVGVDARVSKFAVARSECASREVFAPTIEIKLTILYSLLFFIIESFSVVDTEAKDISL